MNSTIEPLCQSATKAAKRTVDSRTAPDPDATLSNLEQLDLWSTDLTLAVKMYGEDPPATPELTPNGCGRLKRDRQFEQL